MITRESRHCYRVMLLTGSIDEGVLHFYEQAGFSRNRKVGFLASAPPQDDPELHRVL